MGTNRRSFVASALGLLATPFLPAKRAESAASPKMVLRPQLTDEQRAEVCRQIREMYHGTPHAFVIDDEIRVAQYRYFRNGIFPAS